MEDKRRRKGCISLFSKRLDCAILTGAAHHPETGIRMIQQYQQWMPNAISEVVDGFGNSVLHIAAAHGHYRIVNHILSIALGQAGLVAPTSKAESLFNY